MQARPNAHSGRHNGTRGGILRIKSIVQCGIYEKQDNARQKSSQRDLCNLLTFKKLHLASEFSGQAVSAAIAQEAESYDNRIKNGELVQRRPQNL
jgi:hypothetical protein